MRRLAWSALFCLLATSASAQSITSFAPDTTSDAARHRTPPDMVDVPVWFGLELAPWAGPASRFESQELTEVGHSTPWLGVSAAWPWKGPQQGWLSAGYSHWEFDPLLGVTSTPSGPGVLIVQLPLSLDRFMVRTGVDQLIGRDHIVSGAIGLGAGAGFGWAQAGLLLQSVSVATGELVAHAFVFVRPVPTIRLGVGASGAVSAEYLDGEITGPWQHVELVLRLEQALRLPKRIVPGL